MKQWQKQIIGWWPLKLVCCQWSTPKLRDKFWVECHQSFTGESSYKMYFPVKTIIHIYELIRNKRQITAQTPNNNLVITIFLSLFYASIDMLAGSMWHGGWSWSHCVDPSYRRGGGGSCRHWGRSRFGGTKGRGGRGRRWGRCKLVIGGGRRRGGGR